MKHKKTQPVKKLQTLLLLTLPIHGSFIGCSELHKILVDHAPDKSLIEPVPTYAGLETTDKDLGVDNLDDIADGVGEIGLGAIAGVRAGTNGELGECGRQKANDGFKVGFVWKPKSDGAFKGSVAVLPERFLGECKQLTITEKVKGKDKVSVLRNKGTLYGREVFILDGREGDKVKKNAKLSCGCRYWIINDPSRRVD